MAEEKLIELLKNNLELDVESTEIYQGCSGDTDGNLYRKQHSVKPVLVGEVISEVLVG